MHPARSGSEAAAVNRPANSTHKMPQTPGDKTTTLAPLPLTQTTLPTLTPAPATSSGSSDNTPTDSTASPQATGSSAASSPTVQSAVPNAAASNPLAPLKTGHGSSRSLFHGLLKVL